MHKHSLNTHSVMLSIHTTQMACLVTIVSITPRPRAFCYHIRFRLSGSIQQAVCYIPIYEARFHVLFAAPYRLRITYTFTIGAVDCSVNHAFSYSKSLESKLLSLLATYLSTRKLGFAEWLFLNGQRERGSNSKGNVSLTQFSR